MKLSDKAISVSAKSVLSRDNYNMKPAPDEPQLHVMNTATAFIHLPVITQPCIKGNNTSTFLSSYHHTEQTVVEHILSVCP